MRSIDLTFDADLDRAVRHEWMALAEAELPSLASHAGASNRPHITFAAGDAMVLAGQIEFEPVDLELGAVVLFPRKSGFVLARSIVPTGDLLRLHQRVHALVDEALPHTLVDRWTPHVTLSRRVSAEQLPVALRALTELHGSALVGTGAGMRLWDSATLTVTALPATASHLSTPVEEA